MGGSQGDGSSSTCRAQTPSTGTRFLQPLTLYPTCPAQSLTQGRPENLTQEDKSFPRRWCQFHPQGRTTALEPQQKYGSKLQDLEGLLCVQSQPCFDLTAVCGVLPIPRRHTGHGISALLLGLAYCPWSRASWPNSQIPDSTPGESCGEWRKGFFYGTATFHEAISRTAEGKGVE